MDSRILKKLNAFTGYKDADTSYSPMFSEIGLEITAGKTGIGSLWFHYNRATVNVFEQTAAFPYKPDCGNSDFCRIVFEGNSASLAFYAHNSFLIEISGNQPVPILRETAAGTANIRIEHQSKKRFLLCGYSENRDARDPDKYAPFITGIMAVKGEFDLSDGFSVIPENGKAVIALTFEGGECNTESIMKKLEAAPENTVEAAKICREWFKKYTDSFPLKSDDDSINSMFAECIRGMLFNTTAACGKLKNHLSAFPSRGGYPCHFIWDTYFQNLGYEFLSADLCRDFLLQIIDNRRADGKFPQFMCSTWDRPGEAQPALFGFAVRNIIGDDTDFAAKIIDALEANNNWWLTARMTEYGLIFCPHGLETGQDDSPRFDNGPTIAADMNSYLLDQLRETAEIAAMLGSDKKAEKWNAAANTLAANMLKYLYDDTDNLFYDINPETGEKIKIITVASFLPLWAGADPGNGKAEKMIEKYLLSPEYMFGSFPFPSVAYNQPVYEPGGWWRGPVWMPTSYLMLELLRKFGYDNERKEAIRKTLDMLTADGELREFFNSQTGEGGGERQQGWTCGIFIKLAEEIL